MISIKTDKEIFIMREGGKIQAEILKKVSESVKPGILTKDLNDIAKKLILSHNVQSAFLGYGGYPANVCVSVNEEVVHCVPSDRIIKGGDIVSIDFGIKYSGFYLDSAVTVIAGKGNAESEKLLQITRDALFEGIKQVKPGAYTGDIGSAIQKYVEKNDFSVIRGLVGHGIGKFLHEEPQIPNFGSKRSGVKLKKGMVLAIEPMVTTGSWEVELIDDGFTYKTKDGSKAAHFEHSVAVMKEGPLILTNFH